MPREFPVYREKRPLLYSKMKAAVDKGLRSPGNAIRKNRLGSEANLCNFA